MQVEEITQILRESPSVRLIKSRSVDFFLSFVIEAFEGQSAIMQERFTCYWRTDWMSRKMRWWRIILK